MGTDCRSTYIPQIGSFCLGLLGSSGLGRTMTRARVARILVPMRRVAPVTILVSLIMTVAVAGVIQESYRTGNQEGPTPTGTGPGASSGPAENTVIGQVMTATADSTRTMTFQSMQGVTHYRLNVVSGAPFELRPYNDPSSACLGSTCIHLPDFDIAFFRDHGDSSARVGERHYNTGPESGTVPTNADFAHVYLRTPGIVPDTFQGYSFVYLQGNPGSDVVPDWPR